MSLAERAAGREVLEALAKHLEDSGITIEEVGRISTLGGWQNAAKLRRPDGTDEIVKTDLFRFEVHPKFDEGPEWQPVDRGPAVRLPAVRKPKVSSDGWETIVVLPDAQIGYWRDADGELVATHDEAAMAVALEMIRTLEPTSVVRVGDDLDLPELGKYRVSPAFAGTTQAAIDRATLFNAQIRAALGEGDIVWLAGNHEERLSMYIMDNARAAFGLRRGQNTSAWPVMSVPYLTRTDDFGVTYVPGFPAADYVILEDELRVVHGLHVTSRGQTAHKYLDREKSSVLYGHIHRREYAARSYNTSVGHREIYAASPGCLARTDGAVPSTKGAVDLDGRPLIVKGLEDWQQGVGVVHLHRETGRHSYDNVAISSDGPELRWARYGGRTFEATS